MEAYLHQGHIKLEQDLTDLHDRKSLSERPVALPQRESYLFRDTNRNECNVFRNTSDMESCIKEEHDTDLDENGPVTDRCFRENEHEYAKRYSGNVFGNDGSFQSQVKPNQEISCNFNGNQSVTNGFSRLKYQCDVVIPLERKQSGPLKICNIKQEEFDDDVNGIIGGFLDDGDNEDLLLDNQHDKEELKQKILEDHHMHVSRFQLTLIRS